MIYSLWEFGETCQRLFDADGQAALLTKFYSHSTIGIPTKIRKGSKRLPVEKVTDLVTSDYGMLGAEDQHMIVSFLISKILSFSRSLRIANSMSVQDLFHQR